MVCCQGLCNRYKDIDVDDDDDADDLCHEGLQRRVRHYRADVRARARPGGCGDSVCRG